MGQAASSHHSQSPTSASGSKRKSRGAQEPRRQLQSPFQPPTRACHPSPDIEIQRQHCEQHGDGSISRHGARHSAHPPPQTFDQQRLSITSLPKVSYPPAGLVSGTLLRHHLPAAETCRPCTAARGACTDQKIDHLLRHQTLSRIRLSSSVAVA